MRILINILAGYRLIRLIQRDEIMRPAREFAHRSLKFSRFSPLRPLLDCPWCLGVWVAGFIVFADDYIGTAWEILAKILALSALIGFMAWWDQKHIK